MKTVLLIAGIVLSSAFAYASDSLVQEPDGTSYNYVSSYSVLVEAPTETVWSHVEQLSSWMTEFSLTHVSGETGNVGEVLRLYEGMDFLIQVTHKVPEKLFVISNLPSSFKGEDSTGTAIISLTPFPEGTMVNLVMNRRYEWTGDGDNPMLAYRSSAAFQQNTANMWNGFLDKLKAISLSD